MTQATGLALGARESQGGGRIYVNLRAGRIGQTAPYPKGTPEEIDAKIRELKTQGYTATKSKKSSGEITHFFAKTFDDITGYVTDIRWHSHTFQSGGEQSGWNITIDTTQEVYVLFVSNTERPYRRLMSTLLGADFDKPIRFVGFMGDYQGNAQKVLLLSQELDENDKPIWLKPLYPERWLSLIIRNKLKNKVELDDKEKKNVAYQADGVTPDNSYPYILQKADGKWSFDTLDDFLVGKMKDEVIPNVEEAAARRGHSSSTVGYTGGQSDAAEPTAPAADPEYDDDIPF